MLPSLIVKYNQKYLNQRSTIKLLQLNCLQEAAQFIEIDPSHIKSLHAKLQCFKYLNIQRQYFRDSIMHHFDKRVNYSFNHNEESFIDFINQVKQKQMEDIHFTNWLHAYMIKNDHLFNEQFKEKIYREFNLQQAYLHINQKSFLNLQYS
ncbi:hypothetical protein pb186bvf_018116 [Paramecium bursaria]